MKLDKINLKHFRSINNCTIHSGTISALVGENNSGKSGILRALNVFFNYEHEERYLFEGLHQYSNKSLVNIELTFSDVPNSDRYRDLLNNGDLTIKMNYSFATKKRTLYYRRNGRYETLPNDFIAQLKEDTNYVLIPSSRDHSQVVWAENAGSSLIFVGL